MLVLYTVFHTGLTVRFLTVGNLLAMHPTPAIFRQNEYPLSKTALKQYFQLLKRKVQDRLNFAAVYLL